MKKYLFLVLIASLILGGCGQMSKFIPGFNAPKVMPPNSTQTELQKKDAQTPPPVATETPKKSEEVSPTVQDLESLSKKLEKTTNEAERQKILDDIQKIIEQAEKAAPKK